MVDCGRGAPSAYVEAGLDFAGLAAIFLTHLHVDHIGDLPGMLLYPWGVRSSDGVPLPPVRVYGPGRPPALPEGDEDFSRRTTINPALPAPGTTDLVEAIMAGFAYHLNVMPLDASMPDAGALVRGNDVCFAPPGSPVVVLEDATVTITATEVTHGHAIPALAYRFDTPGGSVVFSGDTTANEHLIGLAEGADVLVHSVADLQYLQRHGFSGPALDRMAGLHTDVSMVGSVAERAHVRELVLTHYLPAERDAIRDEEWAKRAGRNFSGRTVAGTDGLRQPVRS
jgi:ribonuclease BN (tRNA processing enzyme)